MSLPPITLDELIQATNIDPANDLMLVRQGAQDYKATVNQIAGINFNGFSLVPTPLVSTDRILVGRVAGLGFSNYYATLEYFGFPSGTKMYFYQTNPPAGWSLDVSVEDRVLAVRGGGGGGAYFNSGLAGTWLQANATLTVAQIPAHVHEIAIGYTETDSRTVSHSRAARSPRSDADKVYTSNGATGIGGGPQLQGQPHNHGSTWRPAAAVGCIGEKN